MNLRDPMYVHFTLINILHIVTIVVKRSFCKAGMEEGGDMEAL